MRDAESRLEQIRSRAAAMNEGDTSVIFDPQAKQKLVDSGMKYLVV